MRLILEKQGKAKVNMTGREIARHLKDNGYELVSTKGAHDKWKHPDHEHHIAVPRHKGDLSPGTVEQIMKKVDSTNKKAVNETMEKLQTFTKIVNGKKTKVPTRKQKQFQRIDD